MTKEDVRSALNAIGLTDDSLAWEIGVSSRTIARWRTRGADGLAAFTLRLISDLCRRHQPWRRGEVAIKIGPSGHIEMDLGKPLEQTP